MQRTESHYGFGRMVMKAAVCMLALLSAAGVAVADAAGTTASTANAKAPTTSKPNLSWSLDAPASTWYLGPNQNKGAEFVVTISASSNITALRVSHSTILDADTGRGVSLSAEYFHICTAPTAPVDQCAKAVEGAVAALKKQLSDSAGAADKPQQPAGKITLWLVVDENSVPNGTFTGNLFIDTEPVTDTKTLQLTIQHTTPEAKTWGVVGILAGVIVAWVITVFARSRINRDQALLPVELLGQKLSDLQAQLAAISSSLKPDISNTLQKIAGVQKDLSISSLDDQQLLPPSLPAWVQSTTQAAALQNFIQARAQIVDNLNVIATGIQQASNLAATIPPARLPDLQALTLKIDQFSTNLPQISATLQSQIKALFDAWNATPQAQALGPGGSTQLLALPAASPVGIYRIRMEIQTITLLFWALWGALSVLIGFTVLVMPAAGFGTLADYLRCSLWGFGLPVAGQGLQTLTMSSLNTQLGVTLPK
jgi:hypothetical protein